MKGLVLESIFTFVGLCSFGFVENAPVITINPGANNEMTIAIDSRIHIEYGVTYPLTYEFSIAGGRSGLLAYKRHSSTDEWAQVSEKIPGDFFNAVDAVRFDRPAERVLLSVGFTGSSDSIYVKIADSSGQAIPAQFKRICRYYDDRDAVVSCSADDYADWNRTNFLTTIRNFRSRHLWLSVAVNSGVCNQQSFDSLQVELNRGYVEAAAHSRTHSRGPYADPDSEITGCKLDLITRLVMPPLFRSAGHEYVYTWVAPYGYDDEVVHALLGQDHFLANRQYYIDPSSADLPAWDEYNGVYGPFGVTREIGPAMAGFMGTGDSTDLNDAFDEVVARGGIYFLMCHPSIVEWNKAYTWSHLTHISDHTNMWYVSLGHLFVYHFAQERYQYITTSVTGNTPNVPPDFALNQNYPNPFNPSTTIRYSLPHASEVQLTVFNTLGQQVAVLQNEEMEAGDHETQFNASGLSSGMYFYRLKAGGFLQTRKLLLLR